MEYDVIFIHPPSIFDFRNKNSFPGPVSRSVFQSTYIYTTMPIGFLTMAANLDRNGFDVKICNLGKMMLSSSSFDAQRFIGQLQSKIFGIDLHWCAHSQGAIETAKLIKEYHPDAYMVFGGLTSTRFHEEIISKFPFVDGVIRGEAEEPIVHLAEAVCKNKDLTEVPNLTSRNKNGSMFVNPYMTVCNTLDEYDFHRYDLLEPKVPKECLGITILRGCPYNCVTCGGSAYSCKTLLHRDRPAFRSPSKIVEDMQRLADQGFRQMGFFHDLRIGGRKYYNELFSLIRKERPDIRLIVSELYAPADQDYLKNFASLSDTVVVLQISPESGNDEVRTKYGRKYTNSELLRTVELSKGLGLRIQLFFMLGLPDETRETIAGTINLWQKLLRMNTKKLPSIMADIDLMVQLDPGSQAFDLPQKYGYKITHGSFEDLYSSLDSPLWTDWMNYETVNLTKAQIINLFFETIIRQADILDELGLVFSKDYTKYQRFRYGKAEKYVIEQVKNIFATSVSDPEKKHRLHELYRSYLAYNTLRPHPWVTLPFAKLRFGISDYVHTHTSDPYNYRKELKRIWNIC